VQLHLLLLLEHTVNVKGLYCSAIDCTIPTVLPEVFPIQAPIFNCDKNVVPDPVTTLLFVAQVTVNFKC